MSPLLLARLVGLTGDLDFIAWTLVAVGVTLEYVAWTAGLGAAALARFNRPSPPPVITQHGGDQYMIFCATLIGDAGFCRRRLCHRPSLKDHGRAEAGHYVPN